MRSLLKLWAGYLTEVANDMYEYNQAAFALPTKLQLQ